MEETSKIQQILKNCSASLEDGKELVRDYKIAFYAMAKADEIAQAACEVVGEKLNEHCLAEVRIHVLNSLAMRYEDSIELCTDHLIEPEPVVKDEYAAACSILCKCYFLMHCNEADKEVGMLSKVMKNYGKAQDFINKAIKARSAYEQMCHEVWRIF